MAVYTREQKIRLGELLGDGHRHFGRVAARMPYYDDEGGGDLGENIIKSHPLLDEQPQGAPSDMTAVASDLANLDKLAEERELEATLTLQQKLQARKDMHLSPKPSPSQ